MGGDKKWSPYLEKMREQVDQLALTELGEWKGHDLAPAGEFATPQASGGFRAYGTEKVGKIGIGSICLKETVHYGFCTIISDEDHDLPIYISKWEERDQEITFLVDIMPTVDSLINEDYRKKYIESMQPLWDKYASLPGICPEESDVIRSLCSIIYTAARVPIDKEGTRLAALAPHTVYLKSYLDFLREAVPVKDDARRKEAKIKKETLLHTLNTRFFEETMKDSLDGSIEDNLLKLITTILF